MDVAHGKRSKIKIKIRSIIFWLYGFCKKGMGQIKRDWHSGVIRKILMYPSFRTESDLSDILNRVLWGFPFKKNLEISVMLENSNILRNIDNIGTPKYQRRYLNENRNHIKFIKESESFSGFDKIIIWNKHYAMLPKILSHIEKLEIADKNFFSISESNIWKKSYYNTFTGAEKISFNENSRKNFRSLTKNTTNKKKGYCFLTGPSFNEYKKYEFETDSIKVICNTIVINNEFLEYINGLDVIAFADPVFHFSSCEYAALFREHVLKVVEKYSCYVIVPEETVPLLITHYPLLKDYLIGIGLIGSLNFPTQNNLTVKGAASIVTYLMTPLLSSLCNEIYFLGADGREKSENYFWKHNKSVQLTEEMESVFNTHPSFFRDRIYEDSYNEHCEYFEKLLEYGEKQDKKYYSLTKSFIPALAKRSISFG